jgi:hypothetical protein
MVSKSQQGGEVQSLPGCAGDQKRVSRWARKSGDHWFIKVHSIIVKCLHALCINSFMLTENLKMQKRKKDLPFGRIGVTSKQLFHFQMSTRAIRQSSLRSSGPDLRIQSRSQAQVGEACLIYLIRFRETAWFIVKLVRFKKVFWASKNMITAQHRGLSKILKVLFYCQFPKKLCFLISLEDDEEAEKGYNQGVTLYQVN